MRIDVLEKVALAAGFAGACDEDLHADPLLQASPDIPAPRAVPSTALVVMDVRPAASSIQMTTTWLATAPVQVARSITTLLGRGAPA